MKEKGSISIHTENIFPIIKKFLYSDHEIFLRELVSNAVDATQKLKKLAALGEATGELGDLKIEVRTILPFQSTSRGRPTLTDNTFMTSITGTMRRREPILKSADRHP